MIKHVSDAEVPSYCVSPIRGNSKHQMTPLRTKRKLSRKDQSTDVHTCSTPNRMQSGSQRTTFNSPSDPFLCSQDNRPDVIWDYTSPSLPKGSKKREIKITVDEFLRSLPQEQAPHCNTQNSNYIKLLEKWMAKQNTPVIIKKPIRTMKRDSKVRSRRVLEEIKQFMESIQQKDEDKTEENKKDESTDETNLPNIGSPKQPNIPLNKKSFLEGDSNENDSIEELWGEADNSFIVKATQHLEVSCCTALNKNVDILSTIPETIPNRFYEPNKTNYEAQPSVDNFSLNKDSDHQAQVLLTQILNCDWDSESENGDLENGFIFGDEDLSLIPDEILCGTDNEINTKFERKEQNDVEQQCDNKFLNNKLQDSSDSNDNRSSEIALNCSEFNKITFQANNMSEVEIFKNFEDDSFDDESILSKPEVLSWIDEVENKLSQSQKCTAQEIEKKKDEAIQRRKRNQTNSKISPG